VIFYEQNQWPVTSQWSVQSFWVDIEAFVDEIAAAAEALPPTTMPFSS